MFSLDAYQPITLAICFFVIWVIVLRYYVGWYSLYGEGGINGNRT